MLRYSPMKGIPIIGLMVALSCGLHAQSVQSPNLPRYDQKQIHFGFILGSQNMGFHYRPDTQWPTGVFGVELVPQWGYTVGIVSDLRLNNFMNLRFVPTYSAGERQLIFDAIDPTDNQRKSIVSRMESSLIIFPLELKVKTERIGNHRWYVLGAISGQLDLASKAKVIDDRFFKLQASGYGFDVAVGMDFYFEYFKLSPQFRITIGQSNLHVDDGTAFAQAIPLLQTRSVGWVFAFE